MHMRFSKTACSSMSTAESEQGLEERGGMQVTELRRVATKDSSLTATVVAGLSLLCNFKLAYQQLHDASVQLWQGLFAISVGDREGSIQEWQLNNPKHQNAAILYTH